jgi:phosphate/phosphite/phosphonate ABC transporter binding protein
MTTPRLAVGIALTTDPERARAQLDELCVHLGEAIGLPVTAHGMWHYHHLLEALGSGDVDVVWLPPVLALRATARGYCLPIALPVRHGVSSYGAALFTRPGSRIERVADLAGARAAWVDRQSAAGYLIPRALLRNRGVDLDQAFADEKFLGTHDAVAAAVLEGEVDVGATFVYLDDDGGTRRAGWGSASVRILCHAGSIPSDIIATRKRLPIATQLLIQQAFVSRKHPGLARAACALLGAERFVAPVRHHLDALIEVLAHLEEGPAASRAPAPPSR